MTDTNPTQFGAENPFSSRGEMQRPAIVNELLEEFIGRAGGGYGFRTDDEAMHVFEQSVAKITEGIPSVEVLYELIHDIDMLGGRVGEKAGEVLKLQQKYAALNTNHERLKYENERLESNNERLEGNRCREKKEFDNELESAKIHSRNSTFSDLAMSRRMVKASEIETAQRIRSLKIRSVLGGLAILVIGSFATANYTMSTYIEQRSDPEIVYREDKGIVGVFKDGEETPVKGAQKVKLEILAEGQKVIDGYEKLDQEHQAELSDLEGQLSEAHQGRLNAEERLTKIQEDQEEEAAVSYEEIPLPPTIPAEVKDPLYVTVEHMGSRFEAGELGPDTYVSDLLSGIAIGNYDDKELFTQLSKYTLANEAVGTIFSEAVYIARVGQYARDRRHISRTANRAGRKKAKTEFKERVRLLNDIVTDTGALTLERAVELYESR